MRKTISIVLIALLNACSSGDSSVRTYACYGDTVAKNLAVVFQLKGKNTTLSYVYDGERLITETEGDTAYEIHKREEAWNSAQFFDVFEFDGQQRTHSYVYFMSPADYADSYGRQDTASYRYHKTYANPRLLALIPEQAEPANSLHFGWTNNRWYCKRIANILHIPYVLLGLVYAFLAGA